MKYAIGILKAMSVSALDTEPAAIINGTAWRIANPHEIPANAGPELLFRYTPDDQFATYVPVEEVEKAFAVLYDMTETAITLGENEESEGPHLQCIWDELNECVERAKEILMRRTV